MKMLYLILFISVHNFIFPCEWMMDIIKEKHVEATDILLKFQRISDKRKEDINSAYWYTLGRTEVLDEIREQFEDGQAANLP